MRGRHAGVKMSRYEAILPGVARLTRLPAEPSAEAKRRWKVVRWCEEHEGKVRLTALHLGCSFDTIDRWTQAYNAGLVRGQSPRAGDLGSGRAGAGPVGLDSYL